MSRCEAKQEMNSLKHPGKQFLEGIKIPQSFYIPRTQNIKLPLRQTGSKIKINPNHSSFLHHLRFQKPGFLFKLLQLAMFKSVELAQADLHHLTVKLTT